MEVEVSWRALASKVLVVAKQGGAEYDWAAYIDAVPGINHTQEVEEVKRSGTKLPYEVAKVLFPSFDRKYEWRT